jgi:hypothetical protein
MIGVKGYLHRLYTYSIQYSSWSSMGLRVVPRFMNIFDAVNFNAEYGVFSFTQSSTSPIITLCQMIFFISGELIMPKYPYAVGAIFERVNQYSLSNLGLLPTISLLHHTHSISHQNVKSFLAITSYIFAILSSLVGWVSVMGESY